MRALCPSMRWLAFSVLVACGAPQVANPTPPAQPVAHATPPSPPFPRPLPRAVDDAPIVQAGTCNPSAQVLACVSPHVDAPVHALALGTTDDATAIAWASQSQCVVQFERISDDLVPLGHPLCVEGVKSVMHLALAPVPAGWLLAVGSESDVIVFAIDGAGRHATRAHVIPNAFTPIFAARPNGTPLLVWTQSGGELRAALVSTQGVPASPGATIFLPYAQEPQFGSAVFVGDGFLVAARQDRGTPTTTDQVIVARVELDGTVSATEKPAPVNTEYPQLAWTRSGALMTYTHFDTPSSLESVLVDSRGARKRAPVPIGSPTGSGSRTSFYDPAPAIGVGDDALVLAGHHTGGTGIAGGLALLRVSPSGTLASPIVEVTSDTKITEYRLGKRKKDAVAAWIWYGTTSLGLARIAL